MDNHLTGIYNCPSCSGVIVFRSTKTNIIQCKCGSVLHRDSDKGISVKQYNAVPNFHELIQPGTTGQWEEISFSVLGRFKAVFEDSEINYWTIQFSNGEISYLVEGYGIYLILKKSKLSENFNSISLSQAEAGDVKKLKENTSYILERKDKVLKLLIEGELLIPTEDKSFNVFEFNGADETVLMVFQFSYGNLECFQVNEVEFELLKLNLLKEKKKLVKNFNCINCKSSVLIKYQESKSCICNNCGTFLVLESNTLISSGGIANYTAPDIEIGCTGTINNISYEVIGYALKEENNIYHSKWKEYTLYNAENGYAFLSEYEGHWIFIKEKITAPYLPKSTNRIITFDDQEFELYNNYTYTVLNAKGEFPYDIFNIKNTHCREFISPPQIWIREYNKKGGINWFHGEHISASDLKTQFVFPLGIPQRVGVGAVQPNSIFDKKKLLKLAVIAFLIMWIAHMLISSIKKETILFERSFKFADSADIISGSTDSFHLNKWRSNVALEISSDVNNSWVEVDATLINIKTGTEYTLEKGVEYYYGYSDGESWSEGSTTANAYFTFIPAGDYMLHIKGIREFQTFNKTRELNITARNDVPNHQNFWYSLLLLVLYPGVSYYWSMNIEKRRWSNSPYSTD